MKIRISAAHSGQAREWSRERTAIKKILTANGHSLRDGTHDEAICLSGVQGVQSHLRRSDGYLFFGHPTIGEMLKVCSLFVGTQTLDPELHNEGFRKPIIVYGESLMHTKLIEQMKTLKAHGTIRQEIFGPLGILRCPQTTDELINQIALKVEVQSSLHGHGMIVGGSVPIVIGDSKVLDIPEPGYKVCVFTSASAVQDELSVKEANLLGGSIARKGMGLVTGLGSIGLMSETHMGCVKAGGWSAGSNCPHIIIQEGIPEGAAEIWIRPDIYERMAIMIKKADAIVIGGGGRGGAGTMQEALACILLITRNSVLMKDGNSFKPIIFDQRNHLWSAAIEIAENYGLKNGVHFHVVKGTEQVIDIIEKIRTREIEPASARVPLISQAGRAR